MPIKLTSDNYKFSVAPMMVVTTPSARYLYRLISKKALLWSEMMAAQALYKGDVNKLLAKNDIGIFPETNEKAAIPKIKDIQIMLAKYGYNITDTGIMDKQTIDVMRAFNEHFNPNCYDAWSQESQKKLSLLLELLT